MKRWLILVFWSCCLTAEQLDLDELMSLNDQRRTGIIRLDNQERMALQKWLAEFTREALDNAPSYRPSMKLGNWVQQWETPPLAFQTDKAFKMDRQIPARIAHIIDSGSLIELENGSVWEVAPIHKYKAKRWYNQEEVKVTQSKNPKYPFLLTNLSSKQSLMAMMRTPPQDRDKSVSEQPPRNAIKLILDDGDLILLESLQLFEIAPIDLPKTRYWLRGEEVRIDRSTNPIYPYSLINKTTGEEVRAALKSD